MTTTGTGNTHFLQLVRTSGRGPIIADRVLVTWRRAPMRYWRLRTEETSRIVYELFAGYSSSVIREEDLSPHKLVSIDLWYI